MVSAKWFGLVLALCSSAAIYAQNPLLEAAKTPDHVEPVAVTPAPAVPLNSEKRADILMARKMYREAAETYKQGPQDSALIQNKIGIAYHQMLQIEIAKKYYERAIKLDPKYAEA